MAEPRSDQSLIAVTFVPIIPILTIATMVNFRFIINITKIIVIPITAMTKASAGRAALVAFNDTSRADERG